MRSRPHRPSYESCLATTQTVRSSRRLPTIPANTSSIVAAINDGVNAPSAVLVASIAYTKTTDAWPQLNQSARRALGRRPRELRRVLKADRHRRREPEPRPHASSHQPRQRRRERHARDSRSANQQPEHDELPPLPLLVGDRRDDDRAHEAPDQDHRSEIARVFGAEPARTNDAFDPRGHAVEDAHAHEHDEQELLKARVTQRRLEPVEHQRTRLRLAGLRRTGGLLTREHEEGQRAHRGCDAEPPLNAIERHRLEQHRRQRHAEAGADEVREGHHADGRRAFSVRKPERRALRPRVEKERLRDRQHHRAGHRQGVVVPREATQRAEHQHQRRADADTELEALRVDDPRRGNRQRNERGHVAHGERADAELTGSVERRRLMRHRCVGDPQQLNGEVHRREHCEHDPAPTKEHRRTVPSQRVTISRFSGECGSAS